MPQSSLCAARRWPGMSGHKIRGRECAREARALAGSGSGLQPSPYVTGGAAGAAAAALVYFATMRLTRGMAASVCFLPMGRSFS